MKSKWTIVGTMCVLVAGLFQGCLNMPTKSAEIGPAHVSSVTYSKLNCEELAAELNSLSRRESALVVAQDQRYKTSKTQAFWYGMGQGDSIEAAELAIVRGQVEAVRKELEKQGCR